LKNFHHFITPTFVHLLALICHPPLGFPSSNTDVLVIDGISSIFGTAFPDKPDDPTQSAKKKSEDVQWASNRKWSIIGEFLSKLARLAATNDIAILLISQTTIKVKTEFGTILRPAIHTKTWTDNINNRLVVFRDFLRSQHESSNQPNTGTRFVGITKLNGNTYSQLSTVVPFLITKVCNHNNMEMKLIFFFSLVFNRLFSIPQYH
jgi:hypothetical protein